MISRRTARPWLWPAVRSPSGRGRRDHHPARIRFCAAAVALLIGGAAVRTPTLHADDDQSPQAYRATQRHMGTKFVITLFADNPQQAKTAFAAAQRRIAEIEQRMSDYRPDSEIRRLAEMAPTSAPVPISDDLRRVLTASRQIGAASDGAFDITVGPLSELWREARRQGQLPAAGARADALKSVGARHWRLSDKGVDLLRAGVKLDLGGIAKGYALDEALKAMRAEGVTRALINGGGDVAAGEPPVGREAWRVGVAALEDDGQPQWVVPLVRGAVATSGDAWQFVEIEGKRYSHVLDPATGLGVQGRHAASVVAPDAMTADGWASALCVLGPDAGLKALAKHHGDSLAAIVTTVADGKPRHDFNQAFQQLAEPVEQ